MSNSFENIMANLERLVDALENDDIKLEDAILNYEKGMNFIKKAEKILNDAQKKIDILENNQVHKFE